MSFSQDIQKVDKDGGTYWLVPQDRIERANELFLERDYYRDLNEINESIISEKQVQVDTLQGELRLADMQIDNLEAALLYKDSITSIKDYQLLESKKETKKWKIVTGLSVGLGFVHPLLALGPPAVALVFRKHGQKD